MTRRILTLHLFTFLAIASGSASLAAQAPTITAPGTSVAVRIGVERDQTPAGPSPIVVLTIWYTSDPVVFESDPAGYRLHIEGKTGEPAKTMCYRQILGEPGLPSLNDTPKAFLSRAIWPADSAGNSIDSKLTLSDFCDLDIPGAYSVYLEIGHDTGKLLRTNTVQFEVLSPKQSTTNRANESLETSRPTLRS